MKQFFERNHLSMEVLLSVVYVLFCLTLNAQAATVWSGDVIPTDPTTWTASTIGYIGQTTTGIITVDDGSGLLSNAGYLGYNLGSTGTVTVTGVDSKWTNSSLLYVGFAGSGSVNIEAGGQVRDGSCYLGYQRSSSGSVTVTGAGSKWINDGGLYIYNTKSNSLTVSDGGVVSAKVLYGSLGALSGNGLITTRGAVLDGDFTFDATHGLQSTIAFGSGGTLALDAANISTLGAGSYGTGTMKIAEGVSMACTDGILGSGRGSTGTATVTGAGSKWMISNKLYVGSGGCGTLIVESGGEVSNASTAQIGVWQSSVIVTGAGSKWTSPSIVSYGTLKVEDGGEVNGNFTLGIDSRYPPATVTVSGVGSKLNGDFRVGSGSITGSECCGTVNIMAGGLINSSTVYWGSGYGSTATATVTGTGSKWIIDDFLSLGEDSGNGTLNIEAGGQVNSLDVYIGDSGIFSGTGTVRVSDAGSMWNNSEEIAVFGNGRLRIETGGQVNNSIGYIGSTSYRNAVVAVDGAGSQWNNTSDLALSGSMSRLFITGGGAVTAAKVYIDSLLAIDVGAGSKLNINNGTGTLSNNGVVRILAGAKATANATYSPISAGTWNGSGTYQPVGGTWNAATHEFTVSGVQPGDSGVPVTIDRLSTQRMLIGNGPTDWVLGASLAATNVSSSLTLTATAIGDDPRVALTGMLSAGDSLLGGWTLSSSSGYTAGDPLYLSFGNGTDIGTSSRYMQVWSYDGTTWSKFDAPDLTSNGSYASFTATALGCYAVTVPEPGTAVLLVFALAGLATIARRRA